MSPPSSPAPIPPTASQQGQPAGGDPATQKLGVLFYTYRVARDTALSSIYCFVPNILLDTAQMKLILPKILLDSKNRKHKKGFKSVLQPYSHGLPPCQTYFLMLYVLLSNTIHIRPKNPYAMTFLYTYVIK